MIQYLKKAEKFRSLSKFKEAAKYYVLAANKNPSYDACYGLGDMYRMIGEFRKALWAYKKAYWFIKNNKVPVAKSADIDMGAGMAFRALMDYKRSSKLFINAREMYKLINDTEGAAYALWCLGGLNRITGDLRGAIKNLDKSLVLFKKSGNKSSVAYALCARGGTLRIMGRFKKSLTCYRVANKYFVKCKDIFGQAYSNCGMGSAVRMLGKYRLSEARYKKAERLYSSFKDEINYAYVLWGHANTLLCLGKFTEAGKLNKKAGGLFRKWKDERGLVYILLQAGELERNSGSKVRAIKFFKRAIRISRKHGLKIEEIYGQMGVYLTTKKGLNPIQKYDKFNTKWYSVLKKNSILNFP
ncbi:MAG: hypothetical protein A2497_04140 [Candidatus Firestonebacteria bacterium RifOxyC12_full_39_7]|nr:MAG: hypothetical protein A2497_04140 [Candidatus Firestonebacteria bacterium RifOxyC12_full_39_7]